MGNTLFAIGEALIDFMPGQSGVDFGRVDSFHPHIGGRPANVCGAFSRLGGKSRMITQLGRDPFGEKIRAQLETHGIDTGHITFTEKANTALAFVSLDKNGERTFAFYRKPSADMLYRPDMVQPEWFGDVFALHFCSVALATDSMALAHEKAIDLVQKAGGLVSFDPNLRFPLWEDREKLRRAVLRFLPMAHILKISREELEFITGTADMEKSLEKLFAGNVQLVAVTSGDGPACLCTRRAKAFLPAVQVAAVDTTGAGDGFVGSLLYSLHKAGITPENISSLTRRQLEKMLDFSLRFCAESVQKKGAIDSYPKNFE